MAKKEYIERNAVVNGLRAAIKKYSDDKSEANIITALIFQRFAKEIEAIPAADVAPVRHGEWQEINGIFSCSRCGYSFEHEGYKHFFNYCPNCGAKLC